MSVYVRSIEEINPSFGDNVRVTLTISFENKNFLIHLKRQIKKCIKDDVSFWGFIENHNICITAEFLYCISYSKEFNKPFTRITL